MPLAEAITAMKGALDNVVTVGTPTGVIPATRVYRNGFGDIRRGPDFRAQAVVIEWDHPATSPDGPTEADIEAVHSQAEAFVDWLHANPNPGDMIILWPPIGPGVQATPTRDDRTLTMMIEVTLATKAPVT